eukprot:m.70517 g.70517  ORF g.70517 m.70517 type:complete len:507 (+) comp24235_c0_seq1:287-1807(+)
MSESPWYSYSYPYMWGLTIVNRVLGGLRLVSIAPRLVWAVVVSIVFCDGHAGSVMKFVRAVQGVKMFVKSRKPSPPSPGVVRLYVWDLSYFSGKVRGYVRYRNNTAGLKFEEVIATPKILLEVLLEATGSNTVPQVQMSDGRVIQDSTEIIDVLDELYPSVAALPDVTTRPCQRLVCQILELLGDEWLLVPAYHYRWAYSGNGSASQSIPQGGGLNPPNHRDFNELQWGSFLRPDGTDSEKCGAAQFLFDNILFSRTGSKHGLHCLGVTWDTVDAWEASCKNILRILDNHLAKHDFVLGSRPSTADYGLLGPLYAHLYRDPVPGDMMRKGYPRVVKWCERCHNGDVVELGNWLADDAIPETILPLLQVFFTEMWPTLVSQCRQLRWYCKTIHDGRSKLPSKSFGPHHSDQIGFGPLTHRFSLPFGKAGTEDTISCGTRMIVPYQNWMLQRIENSLVSNMNPKGVQMLLEKLDGGNELLKIPTMLNGCRVRKEGGLIYPMNPQPEMC